MWVHLQENDLYYFFHFTIYPAELLLEFFFTQFNFFVEFFFQLFTFFSNLVAGVCPFVGSE